MEGTFSKIVNPSPIHNPKPVWDTWAPRDKPPPNNSNKPHGSFDVASHCNKLLFPSDEGIINNRIAAIIATPASWSSIPKLSLINLLEIQNTIAKKKSADTFISSLDKEPNSSYISCNFILVSNDEEKEVGNIYFVRIIHANTSITEATGTPIFIQSKKLISTPNWLFINWTNTILGAVPIIVDIPPIVAA